MTDMIVVRLVRPVLEDPATAVLAAAARLDAR
jgi:hypothetical protein